MNEAFNIHAAKTHFSKLVERAHAGEEITIAKAGVPYAKLVPIAGERLRHKRRSGQFAGLFTVGDEIFDPLPEEELRLWEGRGDED